MTGPSKGDAVGYGRPPKNTRRKKGQSGNRRKVRPKQNENMVSLIDRLLVTSVNIVKNGVPSRMSAMNAIIHQLLQKSLSGNKKAERVLREFEAFASRNMIKQLEIVFVDNEYTTAFAAAQPEDKSV
jgi:hypothetical protein